MPFFAVCYAHVIRYSKAQDEVHAAKDAFGVILDRRITIARMPGNPAYMSHKRKLELLKPLVELHFSKTGNIAEGWEKDIQEYQANKKKELEVPKPDAHKGVVINAPHYKTETEQPNTLAAQLARSVHVWLLGRTITTMTEPALKAYIDKWLENARARLVQD